MENPVPRRLRLGLIASVLAGCVAAGCGAGTPSANGPSTQTGTGRHTSPTTSAPPNVAHVPIEVGDASVEVANRAATIKFASRDVTGALHLTYSSVADAREQLTFSVSGVHYHGGPVVAAGARGAVISSVTVAGSSLGVTVRVRLRRAQADHQITLVHDQVGVAFS